jgi:hypothetical protein
MSGKSKSDKAALARNISRTDQLARRQCAAKELHEDAPEYHANVCSVRPVAETNRAAGSTLQPAAETKPRFVDLFCGIGGFRLAFERAGGQCVFSSDWNEKAQETYQANQILGKSGAFWAKDYFDTYIRDAEHERKTIHYIESNPAKAKRVIDPKDWPWSSARFRDEFGRLRC